MARGANLVGRIMRRTSAALALLVTVLAAALAVYVGPDDTLFLRNHAAGQAGSDLLVTTPQLLRYRNLDLVVRVENPRGVFIGVASQVDVDDYTRGARRFTLVRMSRSGELSGVPVQGGSLAVKPQQAGFWTAKASGAGTQVLRVRLGQTRQAIVVAPLTAGSLTLVQVGARLPGLFRAAVAVALVALLCLLVCVWFELRRRRPGPRDPLSRTSARGPSGRRVRSAPPRRRAEPDRQRSPKGKHAALTGVALVVLSGCATVPQQVDVKSPATRPGVEHAAVDPLVEEYGRRVQEVHSAQTAPPARGPAKGPAKPTPAPTPGPKRWADVDRGPALAADRFASAYARAAKTTPPPPPKAEGRRAYSQQFGGYPIWGLVAAESGDRWSLSVFTRDRVLADWVRESQVVVAESDLPVALPAGRDAAPTPAEVARVEQVFTRLTTFWRTGKQPADLRLGPHGAVPRQVVPPAPKAKPFVARTEVIVQPFSRTGSDLRVVRVEGGLLAMSSVRMTVRRTVKKDGTLQFAGPSAQLYGRSVQKKRLDEPFLVTAAVLVPEKGRPLVLGTYTSNILR